jgi:hypothetical protein
MLIPVHKNDYAELPNEAGVLEAMRQHKVSTGNYYFPYVKSMKDMGSPEMMEKYKQGPSGFMTVLPSGPPAMGKSLMQWFVFSLVVGTFVAYATWLAVGAQGADPRHVFRMASTIAVLGYGFSNFTDSIWKGIHWSTSFKFLFDGLLYGLATGAMFAWMWPEAA